MRARWLSLPAGGLLLGLAGSACAAQGTVIWKNEDCAYFILQTPGGYGLFEWLSGSLPREGDVIEGEFKAEGPLQLHNRTTDMPVAAITTAQTAKKTDIERKVPGRCR